MKFVVAHSITPTIGWIMFTIPSRGWFMALFYTWKKKHQGSASGDYVDYLKSHDLPLLAPKFATSSALPYDARER